MPLRCKPGDLAVVVWSPCYPENLGALVEVLRPCDPVQGLPAWFVETQGRPLAGCHDWSGQDTTSRVVRCPDRALRPIRPQPEGATDETLQGVPAEVA